MTTKLHAVRLYREVKGVQYVPKVCCVGTDGDVFFQYTMIKEASRKRFIYAYKEQSSYSTVDFVKRALTCFGYTPQTLQTDNGSEFTHTAKTKRVHPLDLFCEKKRHYAQDDPSSNAVA